MILLDYGNSQKAKFSGTASDTKHVAAEKTLKETLTHQAISGEYYYQYIIFIINYFNY